MRRFLILVLFFTNTAAHACETIDARLDRETRTVHLELDSEIDVVCMYDEQVCFNVNPELDAEPEPETPAPAVNPPEGPAVDPQ